MALDSIQTAQTPANVSWRPVRASFGIRAFGVGGYVAAEAGEDLIEPHTESEDGRGHEELYLVVRGSATFTLNGERFDAPAGTCVFVGEPTVHRHAIASEPDTEVLAFGGDPVFQPAGDEWIWRVRQLVSGGEFARAREIADEGLVETPGNPGVYYAQALIAAADGRAEEAREWLTSAIELEPRLVEEARDEDRLGSALGLLDGDRNSGEAVGATPVNEHPNSPRAVVVRRASQQDLPALLSLYRELAGEKIAAAPASETSARAGLANIANEPLRELVVAVTEGKIVGTADLVIVPNLTHRGDPWAIVENVVVAEAARRTGVGSALMAHLIERAQEAGCYKLQLVSGRHRSEAHTFYRRMGLEAVAEGFKIYFDD